MHQLALPMPAKPLPPLVLDGVHQAARMRMLAEIADCRREYAWDAWEYRRARRVGYNRDVVDTNYRRSLQRHAEAFRECWRHMPP